MIPTLNDSPVNLDGSLIVQPTETTTYTITVTLADGTPLPSMTVGPVDIDAGADLIINAKLNADKTPTLFVRAK